MKSINLIYLLIVLMFFSLLQSFGFRLDFSEFNYNVSIAYICIFLMINLPLYIWLHNVQYNSDLVFSKRRIVNNLFFENESNISKIKNIIVAKYISQIESAIYDQILLLKINNQVITYDTQLDYIKQNINEIVKDKKIRKYVLKLFGYLESDDFIITYIIDDYKSGKLISKKWNLVRGYVSVILGLITILSFFGITMVSIDGFFQSLKWYNWMVLIFFCFLNVAFDLYESFKYKNHLIKYYDENIRDIKDAIKSINNAT